MAERVQRQGIVENAAALIRLGRPLFLFGGMILYGLGAAVARAQGGTLSLRSYLLGQAVVTAFQLMTHYANDYFDYESDRANLARTRWSGGSGVLPRGELSRDVALVTALVLGGLGLLTTAYVALAVPAPPVVVPVALLMGVLSWAYSAPPVRLHSTGLGELNVALVVTGLVPGLGYLMQAPDPGRSGLLFVVLLPPALLQVAMILAVEFPDVESDARTGKRTLVVRLGAVRAARLFVALIAAAYLVLPLAVWAGMPPLVAAAAALPAPLAVWRMWRVRQGDCSDPQRWEAVAFWSVALLVATAVAELTAFVVLGVR